MWFELYGACAEDDQCANALQTVMHARHPGGIEAYSPTGTYIADREMAYSDVKHG
ncbi:hypothetical protein D9M72_146970 [compost metagenome]|jgi:hypothetical protein